MKRTYCVLTWMLAACLVVLIGCGGGGGGGSSSGSTDQTTDAYAQFVTSITNLDLKAMDNQVTDDEFITQFEQILSGIEAEPNGAQNLSDYLETNVLGVALDFTPQSNITASTASALTDTIDKIQNTETYQMLEAFITTVASNLLLPEPASMLLDFAKPEVFTAIAAVQVRTHIHEAAFSGQIAADTAADLAGKIQYNPFDAERDLLAAKGQTIPAWLEEMDGTCLMDCEPVGGTGIYTGPFSGTMTETGLGCVWSHTVSGTVEVVVTGSGTLADPYDGTFDVSGNISTILLSGVDCDPGGNASISDFTGILSGTSGKLNGSGQGTTGASVFSANISNATVSASAVTGSFLFDLDVDNSIVQTINLIEQ